MSMQLPVLPNILANHETCKKFCALYEECLDALRESFPECKLIPAALERYRTTIKSNETEESNLIKTWHKDMTQLYERSDLHDNASWELLPLFKDLDILTKLKQDGSLDEETASVLWEYVDSMSRHARIYNAIPETMMNSIQKSALSLMEKVQNNEIKMDVNNLDWNEMKNVGESLMQNLNPDDIQEFTNNISGLAKNLNINNLNDVFKLVQDLPGVGDIVGNNQNMMEMLGNVMNQESTQELMKNINDMMGEKKQ
jgi:hypothetical protein